eukprot:1141914-Pelagomonas_calceolata.AAC.2
MVKSGVQFVDLQASCGCLERQMDRECKKEQISILSLGWGTGRGFLGVVELHRLEVGTSLSTTCDEATPLAIQQPVPGQAHACRAASCVIKFLVFACAPFICRPFKPTLPFPARVAVDSYARTLTNKVRLHAFGAPL